jgi:hypothetical protein
LKDPKKDFQTKKWPNPSRKRKKEMDRVESEKETGGCGSWREKSQKSNEIGGHRRRTTPNGDEIIRVAHYIQKERRRRRRRRQRNKTRKDCWLH